MKKIKFRGFRFLVCGDNNDGQQDRILAHDYLVGGDANQGQFRDYIFMVGGDANQGQKDNILAHDYLVGGDANQGQFRDYIFIWLAGTPTKDKTKDNFNTHKK
nr:hypothetical protein [Bacteroidota bacterium]